MFAWRRALYGPMPVQTRTFREIWEPWVHMKFTGKPVWTNCWVPCFHGEFVWINGPESSSKVSPPDWYWSTDGSLPPQRLFRAERITQTFHGPKKKGKGRNPLEKIREHPVELAPRNCRFLFLGVVERALKCAPLLEVLGRSEVWLRVRAPPKEYKTPLSAKIHP